MAAKKGASSPNLSGGGGAGEFDFQALIMAAFQAGQQSAGAPYQGLSNDGAVMGLFDRFAALFEPLQSLAERQLPLGDREAIDLKQIHASLARVDLTTLKSENPRPASAPSTKPASAAYKGVAS